MCFHNLFLPDARREQDFVSFKLYKLVISELICNETFYTAEQKHIPKVAKSLQIEPFFTVYCHYENL